MYYYSPTTEGFYLSGCHRNWPVDCFQITEETYFYLLEQQATGKEIVYTPESGLQAIDSVSPSLTWDDIRYTRDQLLAKSDWTQLPDVPETLKAKWAVYRQQLRDIPTTFATPDLVLWPDTPA